MSWAYFVSVALPPAAKSMMGQFVISDARLCSARFASWSYVRGVIEAVAEIGYKELKKTGAFVMPGLAKFIVIKKPATKARRGINPFTKEPTVFKAKPARKIIKARPVKAAKDAVA